MAVFKTRFAFRRRASEVLKGTSVQVNVDNISESFRNGAALNALLERVTDVPTRVWSGRSYHSSPNSLEDALDNWELILDHLTEYGIPVRKSTSAAGQWPRYSHSHVS